MLVASSSQPVLSVQLVCLLTFDVLKILAYDGVK